MENVTKRMSSIHSQASSLRSSFLTIPNQYLRDRFLGEKDIVKEFNLDLFFNSLQLQALVELEDNELELQLSEVDALDLFNAVQEVTRELTTIRLENHIMQDFLEKNNPKLLFGLSKRRATASSARPSFTASLPRSTWVSGTPSPHRQSSRMSTQTVHSLFTTSSGMQLLKKPTTDFRLNYRTKTEMAEKVAVEVERSIALLEAEGMQKLKKLNAHIEELRYTCAETEGTTKNFEKYFLSGPNDLVFLRTATEGQLERKLQIFINKWLKNGHDLLNTMRLHIGQVRESCVKNQTDCAIKSELSGHLRAVDFEKLLIKQKELLAELEEKSNQLNGLKVVTGKAALVMSAEKKIMESLENESKRISNRTADVVNAITRLQCEAKYIENKNIQDKRVLENLQEQIENYEAPSVTKYIELKSEISAMEKEEKILQRKISIMNIKLQNTLARCSRQDRCGMDDDSLQ